MNNARSPAPNVGFLNNAVANTMNVATNAVNNMAANVGNVATNVVANVGNVATNMGNVAANVFNTSALKNNIFKSSNLGVANNSNISSGLLGFSWFQIVLMVVLIAIFSLVAIFYHQIILFLEDILKPRASEPDSPPMTEPPMTVEESKDAAESSVEKLLPGRKEVFNVSQNKYTYYDAQALCKSLGSELATYDQVKTAYEQGADWCNYGWVEGQMAVYPTQEKSWERLQEGPEEMRTSCGRPGVNGGHFDNPELQFGVSCYGVKPIQSKHDAEEIASGSSAPLSPEALKLEKKVASFRGKNAPIMPFNSDKWSQ